MSKLHFSATKRIALAVSGLVYIFAAPYVVAEGLPFLALWIVVGFGLARQMLLAIAPVGFRSPFARIPGIKREQGVAKASRMALLAESSKTA